VQEAEMSDALREDIADFYMFCLKRSWQQQHEPITQVTADKYVDHLRYSLPSWLLERSPQSHCCIANQA
jgi:hypothetical protein